MSESLFSQSWYRVAQMTPRLRSHAQIHRHCYRQKDWYVLQDHSTGRFHRFSPEAYQIIGMMDGRRTVNEIWEAACAALGDDMPTQDEVISLISQLHRIDVLQSDSTPDIADLHTRSIREQRNRRLANLRSPLSLRFPLLDPDRFLTCTRFLARLLFGGFGAVLWLTVVVPALVLAVIHWNELTSNLSDRVLSMENLILLGLIYPVVKVLHEFGHAYAVKRWGGEVHEMGIMLLVFMPLPYMDASTSSAFREKHRRMIVGGAGILIELFLAALAMYVWLGVEPGKLHAVAYNVMLIAGVSTLLFNGNPLLRYDAYYILGDFLEIPNLGSRGNRYLGYLAQRYLLGISGAESPASSCGEAVWLAIYALTAFVYRIFIMTAIVLFVAGKFFVIGIGFALWSVFSLLVLPLVKLLRFVATDGRLRRRRGRAFMIGLSAVALVAVLLFRVPVVSFTVAEGVVWAPEQSRVYAAVNGFVQKLHAAPGQRLKKGDPLFVCDNPELSARVKELEAQLREYRARHRVSKLSDRTEAEILKDEIARVKAELARARERKEALLIRSPADGILMVPQAEDLPGRFVQRGTPMGYVVDVSDIAVRVVLTQSDIDQVRNRTRNVEARLSENLTKRIASVIKREVPAASKDLPSLALSIEGGGNIALDPRENQEPKAFENLFQFEIELPGIPVNRIGERVYVRFEHEPETLWAKGCRSVRRLLLSRFDL